MSLYRIIRLLTLAVVSCALAALLSGCTKEEFIAGYNEFLFGDWFPSPQAPGRPPLRKVPHRGLRSVTPSPTPGCDAKISSLMSELYFRWSPLHGRMSAVPSRAQRMNTTLCRLSGGPLPIKSASPTSIFPRWRAPTTVPSPRWVSEMRSVLRSITSPRP